jgi:hypothetical protein
MKCTLILVALSLVAVQGASLDGDFNEPQLEDLAVDESDAYESDAYESDAWAPKRRQLENTPLYRAVASWCASDPLRLGWRCDGPFIRAIWSMYNEWIRGVRDCNSYCRVVFNNSRGGQCVFGNADVSTWCRRGFRCACN